MAISSDIFKIDLFQLFKNVTIRNNILNGLLYFGGTFVQFVIAIFTQPIFSKYLELEDFAIIGYFTAIQALLSPLFSMSLSFYFLSHYWMDKNNIDSSQNLSFILNLLNVGNAIIAVISFILISFYFKVFNVIFPLMPFILIVISNLFFEKFKIYYLLECRIHKQGLRFLIINVTQILINTSFSLVFVVLMGGGAIGRMSGIMLGIIIIGTMSVFLLTKEKKFKFSLNFNLSKIKSALKYSFPLIIAAYAYYPIGNIDRIFLERLGNASEYGYYSIGLTISGFISTFFIAFYQGFEPDLYKLIAQKKYNKYLLFIILYIILLAGMTLIFILSSNYIVSFLTAGRYLKASEYANYFVVGIFFMQVGGIFEQIFTATGATKLVMWRNVLMGLFCIIVYYFMINKYYFFGANISRIFASIFYVITGAVLYFIFVKKIKIN